MDYLDILAEMIIGDSYEEYLINKEEREEDNYEYDSK